MQVIKSPDEITNYSRTCFRKGLSIGLVPTMGAFHEGHLSLVQRSKAENDKTIVSIFVNPAQFSPGEDYEVYPRDIDRDIEMLRTKEVDAIFIPDVKDMYPENYQTHVSVDELSGKLCGEFRPGHFRGVATVVAKLFHIVGPTRAYFGQKDYQQALIIEVMVRDLNVGIEIVLCPLIREDDGLAMSSRNAYLSGAERKAAAVIYRALSEVSDRLRGREIKPEGASSHLRQILNSEPLISEIQYASAYDHVTLEDLKEGRKSKGTMLLAVAVTIGTTRLIDNMLIEV